MSAVTTCQEQQAVPCKLTHGHGSSVMALGVSSLRLTMLLDWPLLLLVVCTGYLSQGFIIYVPNGCTLPLGLQLQQLFVVNGLFSVNNNLSLHSKQNVL